MLNESSSPTGAGGARPYRFRHDHRLHGPQAFKAVLESGLRKSLGPITVCGRPNALGHSRLGLSVPRRVGKATRRNHLKRLLREAFRHQRYNFPAAYDVVVLVRTHHPRRLEAYQQLLQRGVEKVHKKARQREDASGRSKGAAET